MPQVNNLLHKKVHRQQLRSNLTPAEAVLWNNLKNAQLHNRKFRRQHSIGEYILDFYCPEEKLAIELDGAGHFTASGNLHDDTRTKYLAQFGIVVMRFENKLIWSALDGILLEISRHFKDK